MLIAYPLKIQKSLIKTSSLKGSEDFTTVALLSISWIVQNAKQCDKINNAPKSLTISQPLHPNTNTAYLRVY
jgi:hypothetical protein